MSRSISECALHLKPFVIVDLRPAKLKDLRFYDLLHTFASHSVMSVVNDVKMRKFNT